MRETITSSLKQLGDDRTTRTIYGAMVLLSVAAAIYFGIRIRVADILVTAHYTSFGGVNFYAMEWWHALGFVFFFLLIAVAHTVIGVKLMALKNTIVANGYGIFSIGIVVFAFITLMHITNVAFPL